MSGAVGNVNDYSELMVPSEPVATVEGQVVGSGTVDVQSPPVLDDMGGVSGNGSLDPALLKEFEEFQEFLRWKEARQAQQPVPKEYIRDPQNYHFGGYSLTVWEKSDFVSSTIMVTAPEPDLQAARGDSHTCLITIVTDSNQRLELSHKFYGTKWETDIEAIADNCRITIDGHEFIGDVMPHPERTWNARVRGLGDNMLVGIYEEGSHKDPERTRKLGESIVNNER